MSTRSTIWVKNEDGTFTGIYCHNDGYLEHNGWILFKYYLNPERVKELISLGSLSSLHKYLSTNMPHTFDNPQKDVTVAYHRDRGEDFCQYKNVEKRDLPRYYEEFNYFFIDGKWKYLECNEKAMKNLEKEVEKISEVN